MKTTSRWYIEIEVDESKLEEMNDNITAFTVKRKILNQLIWLEHTGIRVKSMLQSKTENTT